MNKREKYVRRHLKVRTTKGLIDRVLDLDPPPDCSVAIICTNNGTGLVPRNLCLPHQVSLGKIEGLLLDHPDTRWITVVWSSSANYLDVWDSTKE